MTDDHTHYDPPASDTARMRPIVPQQDGYRPGSTFDGVAAPPTEPDAQVAAEASASRKKEDESGSILWEIAETLLLALLIFLAVRSVVLNFRVDGLSMEPTLDTGQMLLVNRQIYTSFDLNRFLNVIPFVDREGEHVVYPFHPPHRGDIVVFDPPISAVDKPYIKRVIGLPGDTISIHDGAVHINGERLDEPYLGSTSTSWAGRAEDFELRVPDDHVFVMGDNRNNSTDSRSFGPVAYDDIIGRAWISYWPSGLFGIIHTPSYDP